MKVAHSLDNPLSMLRSLPNPAAITGVWRGTRVHRNGRDGVPQGCLRHLVDLAISAMCLITTIGGLPTGIRVVIDALVVVVAHDGDEVVNVARFLPVGHHRRIHLGDDRHVVSVDIGDNVGL